MRVLYVQYTSPYAYPPIMRGAQLLADAGADVRVLGVRLPGTSALDTPDYPGVDVRLMGELATGWRLKAHYARYAAWVAREATRWKADWIYASDLFATPIAAMFVRQGRARIVYHEHDTPSTDHDSWAVRQCMTARRLVVRHSDIVVVPNAERAEALSQVGGGRHVYTVWNCPPRPSRSLPPKSGDQPLGVVFRGSVNSERLPMTVIQTLAQVRDATLDIIGYETAGSRGYVASLQAIATQLGVADRIRTHGAVGHADADARCAQADVGLALVPMQSRDVNMRTMPGASNKVFEYLATGVAPLVTDLPDWRSAFVDGGYALVCDPSNVDSIVTVLRFAAENRGALRSIVARGQARLHQDWNYETQFAAVLSKMVGPSAEPQHSADNAVEAECAS